MTFLTLHTRLVGVLRTRIRNGELSERGLARMVGASQPHLHNVIKGIRTLSPEMGDRILAGLGMTVLDLIGEAGRPAALSGPGPGRPPRGRSRAPLPRSAAN